MTKHRQFNRINCSFSAMFKIMRDSNDPVFSGSITSMNNNLRAEFLSQARIPEAVSRFLLEMDSKLDAILAQLQGKNLENYFPHRAHVTEISGSGLLMQSDHSLNIGDHLEIAMLLSEFPLSVAFSVAKVEEIINDAKPKCVLSFEKLDEEQREMIIRYVVQEERRQIRKIKADQVNF